MSPQNTCSEQKFIRTWRKFSRVRRNSLAGIVSYRSYWIWNISRRVSESLNAFEIQLYPFQHGIGHESNRCNKFFVRKSTILHCLKIFVHCYVKRLYKRIYKPKKIVNWENSSKKIFVDTQVTFFFFLILFSIKRNESIQFPNKNYIPSNIYISTYSTLHCKYTPPTNCIIVIESY